MAVHLVVLAKLSLLTGGHTNWKLLAALLCPFALKLPFALYIPSSSWTDLAISARLFFFRLNQIFFHVDEALRDRRWERALRLIGERAARPGAYQHVLNEVSMVAL